MSTGPADVLCKVRAGPGCAPAQAAVSFPASMPSMQATKARLELKLACAQERMANQLNDHQISPTNYMTAFLRQRGWRLPNSTITIPNVIPEVEPKAAAVRSLACSSV